MNCGSKIAIQQAVPLPAKADQSPTNAGGKKPKILALFALTVVCFGALIYGLSGDSSRKGAEASLSISKQQQAGNYSAIAPSASPKDADIAQSAAGNSARAHSKNSAARSATGDNTAQLNSDARPAAARTVEPAPAATVPSTAAPIVEPAPEPRLAPKPMQVEATFYITRTGKRYHRGSCHHLRNSSFPITRADAEAQGYTPCRVCYP